MLPSITLPASLFQTPAKAHDRFFSRLIDDEFGRLAAHGHHYLDYTGGGLYAASQLRRHHDLLAASVLGNPHSTNPTSRAATHLAEATRRKVLDFFGAREDYYCIFTPNASGALKIVGECFPWSPASRYLLLADNHNSVNGIREYCRGRGGEFRYAPVRAADLTIDEAALTQALAAPAAGPRLFAYPAQSNVSGVKHDLAWVARAREQGWSTLLDAAAFVPTNRLDLGAVRPDFVSVSFYKMFGYPTGIGCLLVRKSAFPLLRKPWFAGGTVKIAGVRSPRHLLAADHERFENGTINYLDLPAIANGLEFLEAVGMDRLGERVACLSHHLYDSLRQLRHANGRPLVRLYGPRDRSACGGTLILTLRDAHGRRIPFQEVEGRANARKISIRSGCFCNPGLDEINHAVSAAALEEFFTAPGTAAGTDVLAAMGGMRGATRVSVGMATSWRDLEAFVDLVKGFRE